MANITPPNAICAGLFSRVDPQTFHWGLVFPEVNGTAIILHVTNRQGGWMFERKPNDSIFESVSICVVVQIGTLSGDHTVESIRDLVEPIPHVLPEADVGIEPAFDCRVWFKQAVRLLHANGIVRCTDVQGLYNELEQYALAHEPYAITGAGGKFHVSGLSK